jgi:hypothetical protein
MNKYLSCLKCAFGNHLPIIADFRLNWIYKFKEDKSQFGEQRLISKYVLSEKRVGFYLEIGCYQPILYSNSYLLKDLWRGISVDANRSVLPQWRLFRPKNRIIIAAVTTQPHLKFIEYYKYPRRHAVLNSTNKQFLDKWKGLNLKTSKKLVNAVDINSLYESTLREFGAIDLLLLDVEGEDFSLLQTLLSKQLIYPKWLLVEDHETSIDDLTEKYGYYLVARSGPSKLFARLVL